MFSTLIHRILNMELAYGAQQQIPSVKQCNCVKIFINVLVQNHQLTAQVEVHLLCLDDVVLISYI